MLFQTAAPFASHQWKTKGRVHIMLRFIKKYTSMYDYKTVGVYFCSEKKLIGVPCGKSEIYGYPELDIFLVLESGYGDDELEMFIERVFNACFSKECGDVVKRPGALQKYTGAKSYNAAVKGYHLTVIRWIKDEGYLFVPTEIDKKHKGAFNYIEDKIIKVPTTHEKGALAKAFRQAMEITIEHG